MKPADLSRLVASRDGFDLKTGKARFNTPTQHKLLVTGKRGVKSNSKTHAGFDNDARTLNAIVEQIIGRTPTAARKFRDEEL